MLTQCPGCQTVFRITEAILQAANGQVRCGRCNTQFDAVQNEFEQEELIKQPEPGRKEPAADKTAFMPSRTQSADEATAFMPSAFDSAATQHEQITMEGDRFMDAAEQQDRESLLESESTDDSIIEIFNIDSEEWQRPFTPPVEADAQPDEADIFAPPHESADSPHSDEFTRVRQRYFDPPDEPLDPDSLFAQSDSDEERSEDSQSLIDHSADDNAEAFNEAIYMTGASSIEQSAASEMIDISSDGEPEEDLFAEPEGVSPVERTLLRRPTASSEQPEPPPDVLEPDQYVAPESPSRWPLAAACLAMTFLLGFQIVHHYRQTLVRHPTFGPTLKSFYALLGKNLEPRWDVNAYSIKQWGIVSDPQEPGVLRVRASIVNNAAFAQPYPLLKLTLEDRFGTHLGARAFKPVEYLPSAGSATRLLDAGVAANVDLAIVDPGEEAVGFQFDSCLGSDNAMRCAHE